MFALPLVLTGTLFLQTAPSTPSLRAHRTETPPTIDGRLDDAVWKAAEAGGNFHQFDPDEGAPATERTEVRILYDNVNLYVGVRLYDSGPEKIVKRLSRRDDNPDADKFVFYVDALHDRRTGAAFLVSAAGSQQDAIISNDTNEDTSWDAVWDAAVSIDKEGWSAELRIPLSQLRFLKTDHQIWGFNVKRFIYRKNENDWFVLVPKKESGLASRMGDLTDIDGVAPRRDLEIVPYSVASSEFNSTHASGSPFDNGSRYHGAAGFDLKYGLKPNVTLNATVNPDFGQVEIDPAVVNLGAFETFFPEKRPFFVEGAQIFSNFGYLGSNNRFGFNRSEPVMLHTRRIGRIPQGTVSGDFVDTPASTTILGAAKLTGKTNDGWSFGILDAVTSREYARISTAGVRSSDEVEPGTNYLAGRILKEFGNGRSGFGALVTEVNRDLRNALLRDLLPGRTSTAGVDGYHYLDSGHQWVVDGQVSFSDVTGSSNAIEHLQNEPQRYFQRTETPEVSFDPTRTSLRGWNGDVNVNRNEGAWQVNAALWAVSPGWENDDLGFHYNGDDWGQHVAFTWKQIHPDRISRDRAITAAKFYVWDYAGIRIGDGFMTFPNLTFRNYWNINGSFALFRKTQDDRLTRGGPPSVNPAAGSANLNLDSDSRKKIVLHLNGGRDWNEVHSNDANGSFSVEWKPSPNLSLSTGPSYSKSINVAQYVTTNPDATATATHGQRYVFARLDQKNLSLETRVNVLFSPKVSLQVYMQPLIVVGEYTDYKSLARPRAYDFDPYSKSNVPFEPNFDFRSFRVNAVFRWEWRLGSTLYVAWTQQRQDQIPSGLLDFRHDVGRVFTNPADNVFLIKISRRFSK